MPESSAHRAPRFIYLSDASPPRRSFAEAPAPRYGWRLDAANNRPLGRGLGLSATLADCQASAAIVQADRASLETSVAADGARGMWTWQGRIGGVLVATSTHPYVRRVECVRALTQFLSALERARPDAGIVRHFGARSLRAFEITEPPGRVTSPDPRSRMQLSDPLDARRSVPALGAADARVGDTR